MLRLTAIKFLVADGVYQTGGRLVGSVAATNRLAITKAVIVQSVNGPTETIILGNNSGTPIRCVYMTNGAALIGFTLTNGYSGSGGNGGGVWCQSSNTIISNCFIVGNLADNFGGGANSGTFYNCTIINNVAEGGGGGTANSMLKNCMVISNGTPNTGGGSLGGSLTNCLLTSNMGRFSEEQRLWPHCIIAQSARILPVS